MMQYTWLNSPITVKAEVNTLRTEFVRLLDQNLLGIYLHGSLALGGFKPSRSDVDIIVVTSQKLTVETKRSIIELLLRISKAPSPLDVHFLAEQDIKTFRQPPLRDFFYNETLRDQYRQDLSHATWQHWQDSEQSDYKLAIYLRVLHLHGVLLEGQSAQTSLPEVPEQAFRAALVQDFQASRKTLLTDPVSFVLNSCRTYEYLSEHKIISKDEGGVWGLSNLPEPYRALIHQSLSLYRGERLGRPVGRGVLDEFSAYIHEQIQRLHD
jgi:predicted nucleotidyltransferase